MRGMVEYPEAFAKMDAGISNCPICGRQWRVTPTDDCLMPECGCFGEDVTAKNPHRPCERCGIEHAVTAHRKGRRKRNVSD